MIGTVDLRIAAHVAPARLTVSGLPPRGDEYAGLALVRPELSLERTADVLHRHRLLAPVTLGNGYLVSDLPMVTLRDDLPEAGLAVSCPTVH